MQTIDCYYLINIVAVSRAQVVFPQLLDIVIDNKNNSSDKRPSVVKESGGGQVVKLLACGVRRPGFDSRSRHLNFRDWLSPASKSRYG